MNLIDSHCHIHFEAFKKDVNEVIARAREAGVFMITVGTQTTTSKNAVELAKKHDGIWATVGLHPNHTSAQVFSDPDEAPELVNVKTRSETFDVDYYRPLAREEVCVAIGECGLDYYRIPEHLDRDEVIENQKVMLRAQLDLATELDLPVVIHSRDAFEDQVEMLREYINAGKLSARGVMHCFTGTKEESKAYLDLGFYISFSGIVTFSKELAEVAKMIPLDKILVETDAPYLAPVPKRGKRNEPAYVVHTAEFLASLLEMEFEEFAKQTVENTKAVFKI